MAREGSDVTVAGSGNRERVHPKGLVEAVSEIEYYFAQERRGSTLSSGFFTTRDRIEYFAVGFRTSFISGITTALFTPVAIGVLEKMIPVFGSPEPSTWDTFFVFLLSLGYSVGYASFITPAAYCYIGSYTKTMVRSLIGGVATGAAVKTAVVFVFFHFLDMVVLAERNVVRGARMLAEWTGRERAMAGYVWLMDFKPVLLKSAYFVLLTSVCFVAVPVGAIVAASFRNRKLKKAGLLPAAT